MIVTQTPKIQKKINVTVSNNKMYLLSIMNDLLECYFCIFRSYFETSWKKYLEDKGLLDGTKDPKPDNLKTAERDKFYKNLSFSGWGGSSGHDAPMIA